MYWLLPTNVCVASCLWLAVLTFASRANAQPAKATAKQAEASVILEETGFSLASKDTAFFSTSLNNRKSWETQLKSGWVAELRKVPYIRALETYIANQWENPRPELEQAKNYLSSPIARDIMLLIADMNSFESFAFGTKEWTQFLEGFARFQLEMAGLNGNDQAEVREFILGLEKDDVDAIPIPTTVFGFQLSDDGNARNQLDALQGVLQLVFSGAEPLRPLAKGLRRKDLADGQILSVSLSADDIPWDSIPGRNDEIDEIIDHVADLLEGRKLVVSLGVVKKRFMLAISDSPDTLLTLGKGESLLASDAVKRLLANQPADLRAVTYTSGTWRQASWAINYGNYFERVAHQIATPALAASENRDDLEEWAEKLFQDCEWLDQKIAALMPKFESALAYSFATPEGLETLAFDWTPSWLLENAAPLAVTRHGGTGPLVMVATRQRWLKGTVEILDAVLDELPKQVARLAATGTIPDQEKFKRVADDVLPIVRGVYEAVRDQIIPAMDGNESLFSISAASTASQLNPDAPPAPEPLPLPELGVAVKLKNRDQFLGGCDEVIRHINKALELAGELAPNQVTAALQVPSPAEDTLPGGGKRYSFPLGAPAPFDQFELQMAINDDFAVVGYSTRQVRDMFQDRPLAARPAWYLPETPTAGVGYVDLAGIFRVLKPWVHYGLSLRDADMDQQLFPVEGDVPAPTGSDILQIWDCFRKLGKAAGTTVVGKDGVTVSRWIWVEE